MREPTKVKPVGVDLVTSDKEEFQRAERKLMEGRSWLDGLPGDWVYILILDLSGS